MTAHEYKPENHHDDYQWHRTPTGNRSINLESKYQKRTFREQDGKNGEPVNRGWQVAEWPFHPPIGLDLVEACLYGIMTDATNTHKLYAYPALLTIAVRLGIGTTKARESINRLEALTLIERVAVQGRPNRYYVLHNPADPCYVSAMDAPLEHWSRYDLIDYALRGHGGGYAWSSEVMDTAQALRVRMFKTSGIDVQSVRLELDALDHHTFPSPQICDDILVPELDGIIQEHQIATKPGPRSEEIAKRRKVVVRRRATVDVHTSTPGEGLRLALEYPSARR